MVTVHKSDARDNERCEGQCTTSKPENEGKNQPTVNVEILRRHFNIVYTDPCERGMVAQNRTHCRCAMTRWDLDTQQATNFGVLRRLLPRVVRTMGALISPYAPTDQSEEAGAASAEDPPWPVSNRGQTISGAG
jgi:hypothetical protein